MRIAVIGLGYVGLPLALEVARKFPGTVGFDVNRVRVHELRDGIDRTGEVDGESLRGAGLTITSDPEAIRGRDFFIVAVPTPVDDWNRPDLGPVTRASETVGGVLEKGAIVVYESTVFPGVTEEICGPILDEKSGLKNGTDYFLGYSPERINPGDKEHTFEKILKVVSGQNEETLDRVARVYGSVVHAGVHRAPSIKVAEAAKVIENTQRDLNIALINELAIIFNRMEIDTEEVLLAAGTKWNFLPFRPGLVGGHCIGVDPYYLTHKAMAIGYHPEIILAGRRLNDGMGAYVVSQLVKAMIKRRIHVDNARILILGLTFKENCPDLRNTRVVDIVRELADYRVTVDIYDPWASGREAEHEYGLSLVDAPTPESYDGIIVAVAHHQFREMGIKAIRALGKSEHVLYDLKYVLPAADVDLRL